MVAKRALLGPALAAACCLALATPAAAQSASKRKPVENPVSAFFDRITAPPAAKKPAGRKTAKKPSASAAAKPAVGAAPVKPDTAPQAQIPVPEPRPTTPAAPAAGEPPPNRTATVHLAPGPSHAVTPPVQPTRPGPAPSVRGDRLAAAPPPADKALLLTAEPVRMAKDAWAPQTRAAMFATEPAFAATVFPPLGSRLAAVAPIELRTPPSTATPAPGTRDAATAPGVPLPRPAPPEAEMKLAALPTPEPPEPDTACVNLLAAGIESTPADPLAGEGDCGARFPVKVVAFQTDEGRVTLEPPATMRCGMARAVSKWVKESVSPTAKAKLGSELRSIRNASSFVCRPRNGVAGAKLSEHGRANALDISAFVLADGRAVTVGSEVGADLAFTGEVRTAACLYLHTVLGPGSDASHADHLHVDMAHRGKSGDTRFCK
jgi:hypothetical protein